MARRNQSSSRATRSGFTLVELLVVIAIIGVLIALLLPAVQAAREAARRTQCTNKLKQLALGVHSFSDAHRTLPISVDYSRETGDPPGDLDGMGWLVRLLPHVEESSLYEQMTASSCFKGDWSGSGGMNSVNCRQFYTTNLSLLHCPSDPTGDQTTTDMFRYLGRAVAKTNYKGVMGDNPIGGSASIWPPRSLNCNHSPNCNGLFFPETYQKPVSFKKLLDGTSKTLMICEDVPEYNVHSFWMHSDTDFSSTYAALNYFTQPPTPLEYWNVMGFRSRHPGGAHFAMADGSVTFFNETIDFTLYRNLSTKAGDELVTMP